MKNIKILLVILALLGFSLSSCIEETFPTSYATGDQVAEHPGGLLEASNAFMNNYNTLNRASPWHADFGYPSFAIMRELMGMDVAVAPTNYNQYSVFYAVNAGMGPEYIYVALIWNWYYRQIYLAHQAIQLIDEEGATPTQLASLGQALTFRAMCYFDLVRMYQDTYAGNQNQPAVPIITENTTIEEAGNNPRATVQEVYDLILSDLLKAKDYLDGYTRGAKNQINQSVAHALLARVYLTMENWPEAQKYAALAKAGYTAMSESEYLSETDGFNNINSQNSWIWGIVVTTDDDIVKSGILNWTAMMSSTFPPGYCAFTGGAFKLIDASLYAQIPDTDFRKKAFAAERFVKTYSDAGSNHYIPQYGNLKFRPANGSEESTDGAASDWPIIRVEEMLLIEAEAAGRQSLASGKTLLDAFAKTRDSEFTSTATSVEDFVKEVHLQRRIELWGEGHSYYDILRLGTSVTRSYPGTNHPSPFRYNSTGVPYWFKIVIARSEIMNNDGISQEQNNPTPPAPTDIDPDK